MEYLYTKLRNYMESDYYAFHMPGHKRNRRITGAELPYGIDITEIEGFDDLHHAHGILSDCQRRAAELFGADESHYLINGSTAGLLSAVMGTAKRGDKILMARNCHKSVYNAVYLNGLEPVYVYPEYMPETGLNGEIRASQVRKILDRCPGIRAVVITSPTYDGVVSDVRMIAQEVHRRNIPLILDEAHGAHFGFHSYFPENGNRLGADIVIHSLHKTLPSLTQTALLHINGNLVDRERVRRYLHMLQSSSPSYVLMASMDECVRILTENGKELFSSYVDLLEDTRGKLRTMKTLKLFDPVHYDRSKILITVPKYRGENKKFTGKQLYEILNEKYLLQMEMASNFYVVAMTSIADSEKGMRRLTEALLEIEGKLAKIKSNAGEYSIEEKMAESVSDQWNEVVFLPADLDDACMKERTRQVEIADSTGMIATEYAYIYPPGIPAVVPGERISEGTVWNLERYHRNGFRIEGTKAEGKIEVLVNG